MTELTDFEMKATYNTYCNAILLRRYMYAEFIRGKVTYSELISSIKMCNIIINTNYMILYTYSNGVH